MGEISGLMNQLFQGVQRFDGSLEEKRILPNLTGGYDVRTRGGEVLASYQPGSDIGDGVVMDGHGETIAHVRENVYDGTTVDFGTGHTVASMSNIQGGENFHDSLEGVIGYSQPNLSGGVEVHTAAGEKLYDANVDPVSGGMTIDTSPEFISPNLDMDMIDVSHLDALDTVSSALDAADMTSAVSSTMDGLDILDLLGDLF